MTSERTRRGARLAAGSAALGIGAALFAGYGSAMADAPPAPAPSDVAAAQRVAADQQTTEKVARYFVRLDRHRAGQFTAAGVSKAAADAKAPTLDGRVHPVYSLNPAFVRGSYGSAEVATFAYLAVGARSATGQQASLWLTKGARNWEVTNIISGTEETAYPAKAGTGTVFTEPQINAWYRLDGDRVTGLNDAARTSVGARGTTLASYQALVHARYADKMPGSKYVREGRLGGVAPNTGVRTGDGDGGGVPGIALIALAGGGLTLVTGAAVRLGRRGRASASG